YSYHPSISIEQCTDLSVYASIRGELFIDKSTVRGIRTTTSPENVSIRISSSSIRPMSVQSGEGSYLFNTYQVSFINCGFYIPLNSTGDFDNPVSLGGGAKGVGNILQDGATIGTHYTNVPDGFFM